MNTPDNIRLDGPGNLTSEQEDTMMRKLATTHNLANPRHNCQVYGNFIDCSFPGCEFHAHLAGAGRAYMIQHNADYTAVQRIAPES